MRSSDSLSVETECDPTQRSTTLLDVEKDLVGDDGSLGGVGSLSGDREEGDDKGGHEGEEGFEGEGLHRDRPRRDTCLQVGPLVAGGEG